MKIKSEKGYSTIDIAISVIVLFIFVTILSMLLYNYNSTSNEIELKAEASDLAVDTIETIKNMPIDSLDEELERENIRYGKADENADQEEIKDGFFRKVIIQDYHDINPEKEEGIVKKVTVKIQYKFKKKVETVELSAIISKEK